MNYETLIKGLDPVTLIKLKKFLNQHIIDLFDEKDSNAKVISKNKNVVSECERCGGKIYRNGKTKTGVQKYICNSCKHTFSETTNTIVYGSKLSFNIWKNTVDNLLDGFSLRRISAENKISLKTAFNLRHKVLQAISSYIEKIMLSGEIQSDETYMPINLKGTKTENMIRKSKKRKSKSNLRGISHHKVCITTAIDENDSVCLFIAGLGKGTTDMLKDTLASHINNGSKIIADSASAYQEFSKSLNCELVSIPSGFYSDGVYNLAEINNVHSQLSTWLSPFRGVSTRHLQKYLNWFNFIFTTTKKYELDDLRLKSYDSFIPNKNYIKSTDISNTEMPIDLNIAYAEYL